MLTPETLELKEAAQRHDQQDPLKAYREQFHFPNIDKPYRYFCGNSLGLQPKLAHEAVLSEMQDWQQYAVLGHTQKRDGWYSYHELVTQSLARLTGSLTSEVVAMNSLTTNLHLLLTSFYRPQKKRHKILVEANLFPSDHYALSSQIKLHGLDPQTSLIFAKPRPGESILHTTDITAQIHEERDQLALVLLGGVQYLSGQAFEIESISKACQAADCYFGLDLAHAAGNIPLNLHKWGVDFAVWCSYKYLNSGPGAIGGAFVHERHHSKNLPRMAGWWGHDKIHRFKMEPDFQAIPGAEGWQLSNPPILQLCLLRTALKIFDEAGMENLRRKSEKMSEFFSQWLEKICPNITIITPKDPQQRGAQLSLQLTKHAPGLQKQLEEHGFICDFREPNIVRAAPVPLYNSFEDIAELILMLKKLT